VTLVRCEDKDELLHLLDQLYDQFKETKKANFIILDSCTSGEFFLDTSKSKWRIFLCSDSINLCTALKPGWEQGKRHALVDRHAILRSYYASNSDEEKKMLLEHMALLLPRERSDKVELKRGESR
jgi:hypothetical protein